MSGRQETSPVTNRTADKLPREPEHVISRGFWDLLQFQGSNIFQLPQGLCLNSPKSSRTALMKLQHLRLKLHSFHWMLCLQESNSGILSCMVASLRLSGDFYTLLASKAGHLQGENIQAYKLIHSTDDAER